jgi:hypothetical protein
VVNHSQIFIPSWTILKKLTSSSSAQTVVLYILPSPPSMIIIIPAHHHLHQIMFLLSPLVQLATSLTTLIPLLLQGFHLITIISHFVIPLKSATCSTSQKVPCGCPPLPSQISSLTLIFEKVSYGNRSLTMTTKTTTNELSIHLLPLQMMPIQTETKKKSSISLCRSPSLHLSRPSIKT